MISKFGKLVRLTCCWPLVVNNGADSAPESINILALHGKHLETMAFQRFRKIIPLKIFRGMPGDSDVIIIDKQLHVEILRDSEPGCLSVVSFLLRPIGAQAEHGLVTVGERDTVHERPTPYKSSGDELCLVMYRRTTYVPDALKRT